MVAGGPFQVRRTGWPEVAARNVMDATAEWRKIIGGTLHVTTIHVVVHPTDAAHVWRLTVCILAPKCRKPSFNQSIKSFISESEIQPINPSLNQQMNLKETNHLNQLIKSINRFIKPIIHGSLQHLMAKNRSVNHELINGTTLFIIQSGHPGCSKHILFNKIIKHNPHFNMQ